MCRSAILEFPIAIRGCFPFGNNPSLFLQTVQRRIERAVLHFKEVISSSLNMFAYLMSVRWTVNKCSQNEHVHRSSADSPVPPLASRRGTLDVGCTGTQVPGVPVQPTSSV